MVKRFTRILQHGEILPDKWDPTMLTAKKRSSRYMQEELSGKDLEKDKCKCIFPINIT
jgi:hypothetical protein